MASALSLTHFSFDLWTCPNNYAMLAVHYHSVGRHGKRRNRLLVLIGVRGEHSGANQADLLRHLIEELEIENELGCFVCNNAESNDKTNSILLEKLTKLESGARKVVA